MRDRSVSAEPTGPVAGLILVADDDVAMRLLMRETLESCGFEVCEAEDGDEALSRVEADRPDLLILDLLMPGRDGLSALRELRRRPAGVHLPVIVVTGLDDAASIAAALEAGATDFMVKPVHWAMFAQRVRYALRASRMAERYRRAREEALIALRVKSEFVGSISHELRTPLNGILGTARLLDDALTDEEVSSMVRDIVTSAEQMVRIVDELLDFARLEAVGPRLVVEEFDPAAILDAVARQFEPMAAGKGLALRADAARKRPARVTGDPTRTRQILQNLVENAIKFTERGEVRIRLERGPRGVRFAVEDTGPGVPPEMRDEIFAAFRQIDGSTRRGHSGTGLGLAICRRLASAMGGAIAVEEGPEGGARFVVDLPLESHREGEPRTQQSTPSMPPACTRRRRILVVEDHPVNRRVAVRTLERLGHEVAEAENGRVAVVAAKRERFDAILMDLQMPELDGFDATREIRRHEAVAGRRTPIIALTAHAAPEFEARCLAAGMDGFVRKPIDASELAAALDRALDLQSRPVGVGGTDEEQGE